MGPVASVRALSQTRSGFVAGVAAYLLWGLFPLYWPLLEPAKPVEILAHRIVWSVVVLVVVLYATTGFRWARSAAFGSTTIHYGLHIKTLSPTLRLEL